MARLICRICRSREVFVRFPFDKKRNVFHCSECGVDWLNPQPKLNEISSSTDDEYFSYFAEDENIDSKIDTFLNSLRLSKTIAGKNVLEIGAGKAFLTGYLRNHGVSAQGVEQEKKIWKLIPKEIQKYVMNSPFDECKWRQKFDLIIMFDLLEHLVDPMRSLKKVESLLAKKGRVLIITPNQSSWRRQIMGRHWSGYYLEHNFIYQQKTIEQMAMMVGLRTVQIGKIYKSLTWSYFWRALNHRYPFFLWSWLGKIRLRFTFRFDDDSMLAVLEKE